MEVTKSASDESYASEGEVSLLGGSENQFNATAATLTFALTRTTYSSNPGDIQFYHQGKPVPQAAWTLGANAILLNTILVEGRNDLILAANDAAGKLIYREYVLWAGDNTLEARVLGPGGEEIDGAAITIRLGDDNGVSATAVTVGGKALFANLPGRTLFVEGSATSRLAGTTAANGAQGFVILRLMGILDPSPIANNDFSQGLSGWKSGTAPVSLEPHVETSISAPLSLESTGLAVGIGTKAQTASDREAKHQSLKKDFLAKSPGAEKEGTDIMALAGENQDLVLSTSGEGPQMISRTFNTAQGTRNVRVRFRFITTEVPGGYFGTQYNDYFSVSIRSSSGSAAEANSMNGLGLGAFDTEGRTAWREQTLAVNPDGGTVQVEATVANVADGLLDSYVVIDFIDEQTLTISSLQLNDIDNSALRFLSASPHAYFSGNTRIHGTIQVRGKETDVLASLVMEIVQGGSVVGTATLDAGAGADLLQVFGSDSLVNIPASRLLFNFSPGGVNTADNGTLSLRVKATSVDGEEAVRDAGSVQILRQFQGANRYGQRDEALGGDDWAKPSVASFIESQAGLSWGDFSNMNGGPFAPHASVKCRALPA